MPKTKSILNVVLMIVLFVAGIGVGWFMKPAPSSMETVTYIYDWIFGPDISLMHFVALDKGYYADNGLAVTILRGYGSGDTFKRLASGEGDFGEVGTFTLVSGISKDPTIDVKMISLHEPVTPNVIYFLKGGKISQISDLAGSTVATPEWSDSYKLFLALLMNQGIDRNSVNFADVSSDVLPTMLISKQADAVVSLYITKLPTLEGMAAEAGEEIGYFKMTDYGINPYAYGDVATGKMINEKPEVVRRFVEATTKGYLYTMEHPQEAASIFVKYVPEWEGKEAEIVAELELFFTTMVSDDVYENGLGHMTEEGWNHTVDLAMEGLELTTRPSLADLYSNDFLPSPPIIPPTITPP